jgi:hypothetical protein
VDEWASGMVALTFCGTGLVADGIIPLDESKTAMETANRGA